jgi:hypothetical protein
LSQRKSPEARAAKRARYRANVAARKAGIAPSTPSTQPTTQGTHGKITGPYDASHLRPTRTNPDPGLLAQPDEPWEHLAPLESGQDRRESVGIASVRVHPTYTVRKPAWMSNSQAA